MKQILFFALFVLKLIDGLTLGKCPKRETMKSFDPTKIEGVWYEVEKTFNVMEYFHSCTTFNVSLNTDGMSFEVHIGTVSRRTGKSKIITGKATLISKTESIIQFQTKSPKFISRVIPSMVPTGQYHIIHSDFKNYLVLWRCEKPWFFYSENFWVLGRDRDLTETSRYKLYELLDTMGIKTKRLTLTKHVKCVTFFN